MAPKKSVEKTSTPVKNTPVKEARKIRTKKEKPEKPKLKTPTIVKLKLPPMKHLLNSVNQGAEMTQAKPLNAAQQKLNLARERKIELSNEVALAQLVKPKDLRKPPEENPPQAKAKQVKPKHVKCKQAKNTQVPVPCKATKVPVPRKKSRSTKKVPKVEPEETPTAVNITGSTGDIIVNNTKKKVGRLSLKRRNKDDDTNKLNGQRKDDSVTIKPAPVHSKKGKTDIPAPLMTETSRKDSATPMKRMSYPRKGKKNIEAVLTIDKQGSPSILDQEIKTNFIKDEKEDSKETAKGTVIENSAPKPVNSRKTSLASDCLSWTKDISSSSTTTTCFTVNSNDFVCIDNKIPIIKLSNITNKLKNSTKLNIVDENPLTDCDTNDNTTKCNSESSWSAVDDASPRGLNLSSPSVSPIKSHSTSVTHFDSPLSSATKNCVSEMKYMIDKLSSKLKKLDMEMVNWFGHKNEDTEPIIEFLDTKCKIFNEEYDISRACRNIKTLFSDVEENAVVDCPNKVSNDTNDLNKAAGEFDVANLSFRSDDDGNFISKSCSNVMLSQTSENDFSPEDAKTKSNENSEEDNFTSDKVRYTPFDQNYDDDDALSLFAESLTGLESSRIGSAAPSIGADCEKYIPQPVSKDNYTEKMSYRPTKITKNEQVIQNSKAKIVCKKQFADSTYKEFEQSDDLPPDSAENVIEERVCETEVTDVTATYPPPVHTSPVTPYLMSHLYTATNPVKSLVFKGVCFFNLISNCKKARCAFPHVQMDILEVQKRLSRFSDDVFISEYMLMRSWPGLRRQYGMCFVERCYSIGLTRILIEMAIDFIQKANVNSVEDAILKVNVNEYVLTHLNQVDLSNCEDLLKHNVEQNKSLCDVLMQTIAETQNFSRFKQVFINLTKFIIQNGGTFSLDVATHILERVCILPCEAQLAHAMISVMQNTDQSIFGNSMTRQFEKQLLSLDNDFYEKFLSLKEQAFTKQPGLDTVSMEQETINQAQTESERYTSPDTTKLDSMNKTVEEPIVKRNLDILRTMSFTTPQSFSYGSNDSPEYRPPPKKPKWQENTRTNLNMFPGVRYHPKHHNQQPMMRPPMRPPLRPPMNKRPVDRRREVFYGTPSNYPRRSGPNFF